jgi:hypothetical protein
VHTDHRKLGHQVQYIPTCQVDPMPLHRGLWSPNTSRSQKSSHPQHHRIIKLASLHWNLTHCLVSWLWSGNVLIWPVSHWSTSYAHLYKAQLVAGVLLNLYVQSVNDEMLHLLIHVCVYLDLGGKGNRELPVHEGLWHFLHRMAGQAWKLSESVRTEAYTWYEYIKQISDYRMI